MKTYIVFALGFLTSLFLFFTFFRRYLERRAGEKEQNDEQIS